MHEAERVPECPLQFGGYLVVRLCDIILPGRKPLEAAKKAEKGRKATVCSAEAKEERESAWDSPWEKSDGEKQWEKPRSALREAPREPACL